MGYSQLSQDERYVIASMVRQRCSLRQIGLALDRSVATVSRELNRNRCKYDGWYRAEKAHERALSRRWRSRKKSQYSPEEWAEVVQQLQRKWSPGQIDGRRKLRGQRMMSKETIYRYIRKLPR
ncbi:helix-turn-helix domain-containing protein [Aquabacterium humicola]|uniref:helix-turn-helix domain-containing protein n=1 Tax=Aquabacterium humicola TaxID=3237377 RepID=UPI0025433BC9|nr:helix-turn-helix domain-containing protein [Rubrivivax pictus]